MERMTRLRAIRLKYGISLVELERHSHVSNQYLSALELGNVSRTANNEEVLGCAIDEIIRSRKSSLFGLEQMIYRSGLDTAAITQPQISTHIWTHRRKILRHRR